MALDKPRYGWEGTSNGGEIYGSSQPGHDISSDMIKQADEIRAILDLIDIEDDYLDVELTSQKDQLIYSIIEHMYPSGTEYVPIYDIKKQLESYSVEQLEKMINQYEMQGQGLNSGGMHR